MSTPPAMFSEEQISNLKNDTFTGLTIGLDEKGLNDTSIDWSELGQLISTSTKIKSLVIDGMNGVKWKSRERSRQLFKNIAASSSIENLTLQNLGSGTVIHLPLCIKSLANLRNLELWDCYHMGRNEYDALAKLLKDPDCIVENLAFSGVLSSFQETVRDALELNTSVKKLHVQRDYVFPIAWTCRNSTIEELILIAMSMNNKELTEIGCALKNNNKTLKVLGLYFGQLINTEGWAAFAASLRNNNVLVELNLSDNSSINNEVLTGLMNVLASNTTLTTLRLESLGQVTREGWRSIATIYIRSPTCALENLYLGGNILGCGAFREFTSACRSNRTLKKLCLKLPSNRSLNTPRVGWNPWTNSLMRIVYNKQSIMETFNSNHVLETICYPQEEDRFVSAMASSPLMGKGLPSALQMNREPDKFTVARRKILQSHYYNQDDIKENQEEYMGYKTLMDTILEMTNDMERTEQLPNIMSWVGRDNDGLTLMYELIQRMPTLCENISTVPDTSAKRQLRSSKRKRND